ncbi:MAG: xylulokinase [Clostridiales bacterium]|nr:xylulokinase [Clostridiales bacterium]
MAHKYLIGIDNGTSGVKCIVVDETGAVAASKTVEYPLYTPRPGWAEQNPIDWWNATVEGLKAIVSRVPADEIVGVSYSGQMHGLVALDANNEVIRPAILWCDQRTQKQCDWITEKAGGLSGLLTYTNNAMLTGYTGGKLIWLKEEEPENFGKMRYFVCPKDYIRYMMTGEIMTDVSEASGTGFFNTRERKWSEDLIALSGLPRSIFPDVVESSAPAGKITPEVAALTGIPAGTPVFAGGGDAVIQTTGAGLIAPGILGVAIGTSGNVAMGLGGYADNPGGKLQMFCNNAPDLWHAFGCTLTAGGAYRWYRDTLCEMDCAAAKQMGIGAYDVMGAQAEASRPGSNGVIFLPYLTGERCPYPDPNARGTFYGLSLGTTRGDITRSVMEGVTYSLKQVGDVMAALTAPEKIYLSGGGSYSKLWRQMTADIFQLPVYTMSAAGEGGAYGAVLVAGVGAGVWKDLKEAASILQVETETLPNPANFAAYEDAYSVYDKLYGALKPVFDHGAGLGY